MPDKPTTIPEYLASLPEDRRKAIKAVRAVIRKNLGKGFKEGMQYGMIGYAVPHSIYPDGYHCDPKQPVPFVSIASQKNHMALYLMCVYGMPAERDRFIKAWNNAAAKGEAGRLDMGAGCVRFKKLEDLPLDVVGEAIRRISVEDFLAFYQANLPASARKKTKKKAAQKKASQKTGKTTGKKTAKKSAAKKTGKTAKKVGKKSTKKA